MFGKVQVKQYNGGYIATVYGMNGIIYTRRYDRKANAYSDAGYIRRLIKLGKHPAVAIQNLGFIFMTLNEGGI